MSRVAALLLSLGVKSQIICDFTVAGLDAALGHQLGPFLAHNTIRNSGQMPPS